MPSIEELNKAIMTIKDECMSHFLCKECPLCCCLEDMFCSLYIDAPREWEPIEGGEQDEQK